MSSEQVLPDQQRTTRSSCQEHQHRPLRLSVSNIAAMTGYHPYRNLPELVVTLVYQGLQELLNEDMEFLGIKLVSSDHVLESLARKAGVSLQQVREKPASTVKEASAIKSSIIAKAEQGKQLTTQELKYLKDQVRQKVDTNYGTFHEDDALDLYEEQCGWPIQERNAEIRMWSFALKEDAEKTATIVPLGSASPVPLKRRRESTSEVDSDDEEPTGSDLKRQKVGEGGKDDSMPPFFTILGSVDGIKEELTPCGSNQSLRKDDDSWVMQKVVVECKHRMNRIQQVPPLYEQIQAAIYCMMYEVDHADIIQVLRHEAAHENDNRSRSALENKAETMSSSLGASQEQNTATEEKLSDKDDPNSDGDESVQIVAVIGATQKYRAVSTEENESQSEATAKQEETTQSNSEHSMEDASQEQQQPQQSESRQAMPKKRSKPLISVSRISLDDPIMNHRENWNNIVLPRLQSFVEAVYTIRSDQDLRRHFLLSASDPLSDMEDAWMILFDLCPWLKECDTAFKQQMGRT